MSSQSSSQPVFPVPHCIQIDSLSWVNVEISWFSSVRRVFMMMFNNINCMWEVGQFSIHCQGCTRLVGSEVRGERWPHHSPGDPRPHQLDMWWWGTLGELWGNCPGRNCEKSSHWLTGWLAQFWYFAIQTTVHSPYRTPYNQWRSALCKSIKNIFYSNYWKLTFIDRARCGELWALKVDNEFECNFL